MASFHACVNEELKQGRDFCLATIVNRVGSAPRELGASFLVRPDGSIQGTIGGGRLEGEVTAAARKALIEGRAELLRYRLRGDDVAEGQMICGGDIDVFLEPIHVVDEDARVIFAAAAKAAASGGQALMVTPIVPGLCPSQAGRKLLLCKGLEPVGDIAAAPEIVQDLGGCLDDLLHDSRRGLWLHTRPNGDRLDCFLEPILPQPVVYLLGGGHISLYLATLVAMVGFRLVVVDDRREYASRERFPRADEVWVRDFSRVLEGVALGPDSYVVIVTRGHLFDKEVLAQVLKQKVTYVGMIGSRHKRATIYQALEEEGFSRGELSAVYSPIGLDIGAETPEEIAVSIAAELIAARAGKAPPRRPSL
jgi:xanthine dehydrogenase accessory factor